MSDKTIGKVCFEHSTWFTGYNEKFFYAKGVYYRAMYPRSQWLWRLYFAFRIRFSLPFGEKMRWMKWGSRGYEQMVSFDDFVKTRKGSDT